MAGQLQTIALEVSMRKRQVVMITGHEYDSQQAQEPEDPNRPHNLWTPLDVFRDFGAHGRFDARARRRSWPLWATQRRPILGASAVAAGLVGIAAVVSRIASSHQD
jgi:hypothetical protein